MKEQPLVLGNCTIEETSSYAFFLVYIGDHIHITYVRTYTCDPRCCFGPGVDVERHGITCRTVYTERSYLGDCKVSMRLRTWDGPNSRTTDDPGKRTYVTTLKASSTSSTLKASSTSSTF